MPELETLGTMQEEPQPIRRYVDIRNAEMSDIGGMLCIFMEAFRHRNPRLWRLIDIDQPLGGDPLYYVAKDILETHLISQSCRFVVAYDISNGQDHDSSDDESCQYDDSEIDMDDPDNSETVSLTSEELKNLTHGLISLSDAPRDGPRNVYATSEFTTYACLKLLRQARATDQNHLNISVPRFCLLHELENRSRLGQESYIAHPYLVINALLLYPECHEETAWDMANKLLGWAVGFAEERGLPIWTQILANEKEFFLQAGFDVVGTFTLNLNGYKPYGSTRHWGTQGWVQMVYSPDLA